MPSRSRLPTGRRWGGGRQLPAGLTFHDLRHFYASLLISQGASVKVIQARLGHKSAAETLDTYGHLWPDDEDLTRQAVDGVLLAPPRAEKNRQTKGD